MTAQTATKTRKAKQRKVIFANIAYRLSSMPRAGNILNNRLYDTQELITGARNGILSSLFRDGKDHRPRIRHYIIENATNGEVYLTSSVSRIAPLISDKNKSYCDKKLERAGL